MFFLCPPVCLFSEALQRSVRTLDLSSQSIDVICDQDVRTRAEGRYDIALNGGSKKAATYSETDTQQIDNRLN
jgi:hypothetical protein